MREDLKTKLESLVLSFPKEYRDKVNEALELKGQIDVVPVEIDIPLDSVVRRYLVDAGIEIVKCKTCYYFHMSSFWIIVKPTMAEDGGSLYAVLEWFCDCQDRKAENPKALTNEEETYCSIVVHMLALPRDLFYSPELCIEIATYVIKKRAEAYTKMLDQVVREETEEDVKDNGVFEDMVTIAEGFDKDMRKLSAKKIKDDN